MIVITKNVYLSILIIGIVFAILSYISNYGENTALTILYFTITLIMLLRLVDEWQYFRRFRASPATSLFLLLLTGLAISASLVARIVSLGDNNSSFFRQYIIDIHFSLGLSNVNPTFLFLNVFGLLFATPWYIFLIILLRRYHAGRYPGIFVQRKKYPRIFVAFYNIVLIFVLLFFWASFETIELNELIFSTITVLIICQYYVFKIILVPVRLVPTNRRPSRRPVQRQTSRTSNYRPVTNYSSSQQHPVRLLSPAPNSPTVRNTSSGSSALGPGMRSGNNSYTSSATPRPMGSVSTSSNTRTVTNITRPQRSSNAASSTAQNRPRTSNYTTSHGVEVAPGINVMSSHEKHQNTNLLTREDIKRLLPSGSHLTKDDFRCIFCYELPIEKNQNVIVCSSCHHPAHEHEYQRWQATSDICSYCNAQLTKSTLIRLSGQNYQKIINYALGK